MVDKLQHYYFAPGELAERSNAAVLKTVDCYRSGGSNPSLSAKIPVFTGIFICILYKHYYPKNYMLYPFLAQGMAKVFSAAAILSLYTENAVPIFKTMLHALILQLF